MKNWKTTLLGIGTVITGIMAIVKGDAVTGISAITTGFGLICAKDSTTN